MRPGSRAACAGASLALVAACTQAPSPADTDSDVSIETGADDTDPAPPWTSIDLSPAALTVGIGADVVYRLRATSPDGVRGLPPDVRWTSSDEVVATIEDGVARARAGGDAEITAAWDGGEARATLHVDAIGGLDVVVIDAETRRPVADAGVQAGEIVLDRTDDNGHVVEPGVPGQATTVCAWADGYVPACLAEVVGRRLVIPLRERPRAPTYANGTADLSHVDRTGAPESLVVGIVVTSQPVDPRWQALGDVLGPPRTVEVMNVEVDLPSNVVVDGVDNEFSAPGVPGARSLWAIATRIPLADALAVGTGNADPLAVLGGNMDPALRREIDPVEIPEAGAVDAETIVVDGALDGAVAVLTGPLPDGTSGDEVPVLLAVREGPAGFVTAGLGAGLGAVSVVADAALPADRVVGVVQQGGLGSGGGESTVVAAIGDGEAVLPPWPAIPPLPTFHPPATLSIDTAGDVVWLVGEDRQGRLRDVLAPAGNQNLDLPEIAAPFDRGVVTWRLVVATTDVGSYEGWLAEGPVFPETVEGALLGTARTAGEVTASQ